MGSDCSFVRASNGLRFAYVEQGEREGPAIVMLHGITDSHRSFDLIRPHLPEAWRVIALTQRGHGKSDKPDVGYSLAEMAADVPAFLDALGIERAIVVGHSMGSAVALQAAADYPDRVIGAVLMGAFADFRANPGIAELTADIARFGDTVDPEYALAFQESTFADPIPQSFLDIVVNESMRCPARVWRDALNGLLESQLVSAARRCLAPAILIRGEKDAFVPHADQLALRAALPSARLFSLAGVGHTPHWERPEETAALLRAFIAEILSGDVLRDAASG